MSTIPQNASVEVTPQQPVAPTDMPLLDHFAGLAMQTLLRIGTTEIREDEADDGSTFDYPDMPFYFGNWEPGKGDDVRGVDSLANDAYEVALAMLRRRREILEEVTVEQAESSPPSLQTIPARDEHWQTIFEG